MLLYNPSTDLNGQHLEAKKKFTENELSGGVGWVLIAMDGNVICNIGWNKSDIRNMKNQNFDHSEVWEGQKLALHFKQTAFGGDYHMKNGTVH